MAELLEGVRPGEHAIASRSSVGRPYEKYRYKLDYWQTLGVLRVWLADVPLCLGSHG